MKSNKILITYSFTICLILTIVGVFSAKNPTQLFTSLIYLPLIFYFGAKLLRLSQKPTKKTLRPRQIITVHNTTIINEAPATPTTIATPEPEIVKDVADNDKRLFLKLIGSTSFSLLLMALFTKKAQASFFGSAPTGPGIVAIKNSAGQQIDPAEKKPTDGYSISEIDDAGTPTFYGFVKNTGAWYILQDNNGAFRYSKGTSNFLTNWNNRASLTYDYFNNVFG